MKTLFVNAVNKKNLLILSNFLFHTTMYLLVFVNHKIIVLFLFFFLFFVSSFIVVNFFHKKIPIYFITYSIILPSIFLLPIADDSIIAYSIPLFFLFLVYGMISALIWSVLNFMGSKINNKNWNGSYNTTKN